MNAGVSIGPKPCAATRLLCDRVLANLDMPEAALRFAGKARDEVEFGWYDLTRRAIRAPSASGRSIGILLPLGVTLRHGDVVHEDDASFVVVVHRPTEVWRVHAGSAVSLATIALELGNLHVAVEVSEQGELYTPVDGPTEGVLRRAGASYELCERRFVPLRATITSGLSIAKNFAVKSVN
jgi:urease accessory protein UreE